MLGLFAQVADAQLTSIWNGTTGNWSDATRWSTNPLFPNNGNGGFDYNGVVSGGTVTLDQAISIQNLSLAGGIISGSNTLQILDSLTWTGGGFAGTGITEINDGTLSSLANKNLNQRTLEILGTVQLLAGRIVSANPGTIDIQSGGTFLTTGSHFGVRDIQANVTINPGGTLINTGFQATSIVGNLVNQGLIEAAADSALFIGGGTGDGDLIIRSDATVFVELVDAADYQFTGPIILDGGALEILLFDGSGISFLLPALLSGNGTYRGFGGVLVNSTEIAPGFSVGSIEIDADYEQTDEGQLTMEIEGNAPGEFDTLSITGQADLGGTLNVVVDSSIQPGDTFQIITAGNTMGSEFQDVFTIGNDDIFLAPIYDDQTVALATYVDGDMNRLEDGLTEDDVAALALALTDPSSYRTTYGISGRESGDIDDDGDLDVDDIDDFADLLNMSVVELHQRIRAFSANVPEPSGVLLVVLACPMIVIRRDLFLARYLAH